MTFIPDRELQEKAGLSLAPMVDFLFLMLAVFASLAVTRMALKDTEIDLVRSASQASAACLTSRDYKIINISIGADGHYKWVTELRDHPMHSSSEIADELTRQYSRGLLPEDKLKTQVLLKIDKNARWEPVLKALLSIREAGFPVRPVYEADSKA